MNEGRDQGQRGTTRKGQEGAMRKGQGRTTMNDQEGTMRKGWTTMNGQEGTMRKGRTTTNSQEGTTRKRPGRDHHKWPRRNHKEKAREGPPQMGGTKMLSREVVVVAVKEGLKGTCVKNSVLHKQ
ncbi:hypothetical protein F4604DRAFT_1690826 [Suillus subluteus]|nr:hypothetical protein F4604DRAFT_1690826 [Suillus subluteus]